MGLGFKVGETDRMSMYIGNQYTGEAKDNIYLNYMLFVRALIADDVDDE
jgi:hypothetical protein